MASLSDLPGISGENSHIRNGIVGVAYVFLLLMVVGAAAPAEDTDSSSRTPTDTPAATDTPADTQDTDDTPTETQAPDTETETQTESSSGGSDSSDSSSSGYQVRVSYDGEWQGSISAGGSSRSVDGSGTETFDVKSDDVYTVAANAQKQDDSSGELTVEILNDGEVVAEQSTSAEYGMAQATSSSF